MAFNVELRKPSNFNVILKISPPIERELRKIYINKRLGGFTKTNSEERPKKVFIKYV